MARTKRLYFEKAVYHISIRGNNRQMVLAAREDKQAFLGTLNKYKKRFKFKLYGFVLMDNHVHMILETTSQNNISKVMQAITLSYSQKFRNKYNYTGYVWQGRFKSSIISGEIYIVECINYIHNNPVRANMVNEAKDYLWSSYHRYNGNSELLKNAIDIDIFRS